MLFCVNKYRYMKIGFFGHSSTCWINSPNKESFIDQIKEKYSADIVNIGVPQGSEERILFDLKKTKEIDIAIIFHSSPRYIFLPNCNRDVSIKTVPSRKAPYFWSENNAKPVTREQFENDFFSYSNIKDVFKNPEEYVDAMTFYKEYFYHPDLIENRFQSCLLLIDNFLLNKNITTFHTIHPLCYPPWLKMKSGTVDHELTTIKTTPGLPNNFSIEDNKLVAEKLSGWIDKL